MFVYEHYRWHGAMATRRLREIARKLSFTFRRILAISCVAKKWKTRHRACDLSASSGHVILKNVYWNNKHLPVSKIAHLFTNFFKIKKTVIKLKHDYFYAKNWHENKTKNNIKNTKYNSKMHKKWNKTKMIKYSFIFLFYLYFYKTKT